MAKRRMSFQMAAERRPRATSAASLTSIFLIGHRQDAVLVELGPHDLADDSALREHENAVADGDQLRQVGGNEQHAAPLGRKRPDKLVDFGARADVDAAGRLVAEK